MTSSRRVAAILTALTCGTGSALALGEVGASANDPQETVTFTGAGEHAFTVPDGVTTLTATAVGGKGGDGYDAGTLGGSGGYGAVVSGDLAVAGGESLYAEVGGNGADGSVQPAASSAAGGGGGGGGGGASDVRVLPSSSGLSRDTRLIVAGGGGGGGGASWSVTCGMFGSQTAIGGGGGAAGEPGNPGSNSSTCATIPASGGEPGTGSSGGTGGADGSFIDHGQPGATGIPGAGGAGGAGDLSNTGQATGGSGGGGGSGSAGGTGDPGGGGGGGGFYGGGGGGGADGTEGAGGGGGGGANLVPSGGAVTTDATGVPKVAVSFADTTPPTVTLSGARTAANSGTPTFFGTGDLALGDAPAVTVRVYAGGSVSGTPVQTLTAGVDPTTGAYGVSPAAALPEGTYTAQAAQADGAGLVGFSNPRTFFVGAGSPASSSGVALFGRHGFVSPSGVAGVFVGCFKTTACIGQVTITHDGTTVGRRPVEEIAAENGGIVHVKLSHAARQLLVQGYLRVTVTVVDRDGATATSPLTLVPFETTGAISRVEQAISASASPASSIKIFGRTGFVNPGGTSGIFLGCFGSTECAGAMTLTAGRTVVGGRTAFYISPNDGGIVHVVLRPAGRRLIATRHKLEVTVTVRDGSGPPATGRIKLQPFLGDIDESALVVSPGTVAGNAPSTFSVALTNASSPGFTLASAKVTAPAGFKVRRASLEYGARGSTTVAGNVIELRDLVLAPNGALHLRIAATVPSSCKASTFTWASGAWAGADFGGRPLTLDTFASSAATTVSTHCGLHFVTEPAGSTAGVRITGKADDPSGAPVTVAVVDGKGKTVPSSNPLVTIALRDNPGGATLGGTKTVHAVDGVARFTNLTLSKPDDGYTLTASSANLPSATSKPFDESSTSAICAQDTTCQTSLSTTESDFEVTASADASKPNAGTLSESVNVGTPLQCPGYIQEDPNSWEFSMTSVNRSKTIVNTIKVPLLPLSGPLDAILNATQACFGAVTEFTTKSGAPAAPATLPDGTPGFIGLLPDCTGAHGPCVVSRKSILDLSSGIGFDIVMTVYIPEGFAGDPHFRA